MDEMFHYKFKNLTSDNLVNEIFTKRDFKWLFLCSSDFYVFLSTSLKWYNAERKLHINLFFLLQICEKPQN